MSEPATLPDAFATLPSQRATRLHEVATRALTETLAAGCSGDEFVLVDVRNLEGICDRRPFRCPGQGGQNAAGQGVGVPEGCGVAPRPGEGTLPPAGGAGADRE
jgi:hypothetical protein